MSTDTPYLLIPDWSRGGRRAFVETHHDRLALLLDQGFDQICDEYELGAFGFHGPDPVTEAVEWSLQRFAEGELNAASARCTTDELFTRPWFWLAQKTGPGFQACKRRGRAGRAGHEPTRIEELHGQEPAPSETTEQDRALLSFAKRMRDTLAQLFRCTSAGIVEHWLSATQRLRGRVFGWSGVEQRPDADASRPTVSKLSHDARFRYLVVFFELLSPEIESHRVVQATMFSGVPDKRPYRRKERELAATWQPLRATRELSALRRRGLTELIGLTLDHAEGVGDSPTRLLERLLLHQGLSVTTLHAWKLTDPDLKARLERLPPVPPEVTA